MVKIVGKIISIVCLITHVFTAYCIDITLQATTLDGDELEQVAVGQNFLLKVDSKGIASKISPTIEGIKGFEVVNAGFKMSIQNGSAMSSYLFNIKIDKPGLYELGPAEIVYNNTVYRSNTLQIGVSGKQILKYKKESLEKFFFELQADKENIFLGQKVAIVARFYYLAKQDVKQLKIVAPMVKSFRRVERKELFYGQKEIDGHQYNYVESHWSLFANKIGEIILPVHRADFLIKIEDAFFGGFSSFFGHNYDQKQIFSNTLTFNVMPLPEYDGVVDAVGNFTYFSASVDRSVVRQGDGIVLTLELEGDGDLENLDITELKNMPGELKYYDSKRYLVDDGASMEARRKKFEFIVQATKEGEYKIPEQVFTFFDTNGRQYNVLKTIEVDLKILPATQQYMISKDDKSDDMFDKALDTEEDIRSIDQYGVWYAVPKRAIPFWIFILLVLLPIVPFGFIFTKKIVALLAKRYSPHRVKVYAFTKAMQSLRIAKSKSNFSVIYSIFITLFAERFDLKESMITQDMIIKVLRDHGVSQEKIYEWKYFVAEISSYAFYKKQKNGSFDSHMFNKALEWVELFKNKL